MDKKQSTDLLAVGDIFIIPSQYSTTTEFYVVSEKFSNLFISVGLISKRTYSGILNKNRRKISKPKIVKLLYED